MTENQQRAYQRPSFLVTIALLAVIIAVSASMVSSQQNQLTRAMIEQTQAHDDYTAASTKMRLAFLDLENRHPDLQDDRSAAPRLAELASDYSKQRDSAKAWADSYSPVVSARLDATSVYKKAQMVAVIAIIVAALSVIISNRAALSASIIICAISLVQFGITYIRAMGDLQPTLAKVEQTRRDYQLLRNSHNASREDEETLDRADPDGSIRDRLDAVTSAHHPDSQRQDFSR